MVRATGVVAAGMAWAVATEPSLTDLRSDTWVATDALGRSLPRFAEVGPPRADRTVGIFYFLWHGPHINGGPYDVSRILAQDPGAMTNAASPLWGPLHAPHHWGESIFGYYLADDAGVLRKHAQMLADAGVDTVVFDVTNQLTYPEQYRALLRVWSEMRSLGNRTPQVAFLCPFWEPRKVVLELWRDLYRPGLSRDLWFEWEGKPLILADPERLGTVAERGAQNTAVVLEAGHTLGCLFEAEHAFDAVAGRFPTWRTTGAAVTLTLYRGGPGGERLATRRCRDVADNAWLWIEAGPSLAAGSYYLEASEPAGKVGWWSHTDDTDSRGQAMADGQSAAGDRTLALRRLDADALAARAFFTFRSPQPDYFLGPTKPDMWGWLEVSPQHVFRNARGEKEQMTVGVAQNAVGNRLGSMSEPGARGRSFHHGSADGRPSAVRHGLNAAEQWERVLREDPRFVFVTGWNEWIAGRFAEFAGIRYPVMFVDQFDQEHSRDIEPMRGGHGDDYYYQLAASVRRYKGVRPSPVVRSGPVRVDGRFDDWRSIEPEFRDTAGDPVQRRHRGWDPQVTYANASGRNDFIAAKVSRDGSMLACYVRTREPLVSGTEPSGPWLLLDTDCNPGTGWLGYDWLVGRTRREGGASVERNVGGRFEWAPAGQASFQAVGAEIEVALSAAALGLDAIPSTLDFKWADGLAGTGDWTDFTLNGDVAPNDRFNYRAEFSEAAIPAR